MAVAGLHESHQPMSDTILVADDQPSNRELLEASSQPKLQTPCRAGRGSGFKERVAVNFLCLSAPQITKTEARELDPNTPTLRFLSSSLVALLRLTNYLYFASIERW